ncbi:MAG: 5'-nucleotidase/apyrase family protein [Armatimonadetes bacterium]|nr:5'-nucleotidase/apyrase family protein [Armatimonadota bacterium]
MKPFLVASLLLGTFACQAKDFTLTVLHTNDLHARVEPSAIKGKTYGGYARHMTLVEKYRTEDENVILLNAGDTFQGTLFFTQYKGLADLSYMNYAKYDGMALGNHEFDKGVGTLAEFCKRATFPILSANLDFSAEPLLKDLVKPYTVLTVSGEKIGVVGLITPDLFSISSPGPTVKMKPLVESAQIAIDELEKQGINKIVLLTHIGFDEDSKLVPQLRGVDIVVGGHSHSPLGEIELPGGRRNEGKYPFESKDKVGSKVLITQAWEWGKLFGRLKVTFDDKGVVKSFRDGRPILVDESIPEQSVMKTAVDAFTLPIMAMRQTQVSSTPTGFTRSGNGESELGNLICDSMLAKVSASGALIAIMNPGGIRQNIEAGPISYETCINVQPFGNTLVVLDLNLGELKAAFENDKSYFLQVSKGFEITYDFSQPIGERVISMKINGNQLWPIPPNVRIGNIKIVTNNFLAGGGDSVTSFKEAKGARIDTGFVDVEALIEYLKSRPSVSAGKDGRIKVVNKS